MKKFFKRLFFNIKPVYIVTCYNFEQGGLTIMYASTNKNKAIKYLKEFSTNYYEYSWRVEEYKGNYCKIILA